MVLPLFEYSVCEFESRYRPQTKKSLTKSWLGLEFSFILILANKSKT